MSKPTEFTEEEKSQHRAYLSWSMKIKLGAIRAAVKKANVVFLEEGKVGNSGQLLFWAKENNIAIPSTTVQDYLATGGKHYSEERGAEAKRANKNKGMREWGQSEEAKAKKKELNAKGYARRKAEMAALKAAVKDPFQGPVTVVPLNTLSITMLDDIFGKSSTTEAYCDNCAWEGPSKMIHTYRDNNGDKSFLCADCLKSAEEEYEPLLED